jgi:hypothetical protein
LLRTQRKEATAEVVLEMAAAELAAMLTHTVTGAGSEGHFWVEAAVGVLGPPTPEEEEEEGSCLTTTA